MKLLRVAIEAAGHRMERLRAARAYAVVNRVTEVRRPYDCAYRKHHRGPLATESTISPSIFCGGVARED